QSVLHRHHPLPVVDMDRGLEVEAADSAGRDVDQAERRVVDQDRRAASAAELAMALLGPLPGPERVGAARDLHARSRPEARRMDRGAEPAAAGFAVAVDLEGRLARELEGDGT